MDPTLAAILGVVTRWIHISSVIVLIGGVFYARTVGPLEAARFRPAAHWSMAGILVSGIYTLLSKPHYPPGYFLWFGIKMLLVLHIFSMAILLTAPKQAEEAKRNRWMTGTLISAAIVVGISAWLRWISLGPTLKAP